MTAEWGSPCPIMRIFEKKIDFGDYFDSHDQENIQILSGISIRNSVASISKVHRDF